MNVWLMIAIAAVASSVIMAILWVVQRMLNDSGIVDVAWGVCIGIFALFFCWGAADGLLERRIIVAILAGLWSLRFSSYILLRVITMPEDGRYTDIKRRLGDRAQLWMFGFYQLQAAAAFFFALPMLVAAVNPSPLSVFDYLGVGVWVLAMSLNWLSDYQLHQFRTDPTTKGQVCKRGLWRYSRHPNYFFEWLHWWSYFLLGLTWPWGWIGIAGPLMMYFIITRVSGIPPTERQAVQSRGDAYRRYQKTTNAFFPWFPQRENALKGEV